MNPLAKKYPSYFEICVKKDFYFSEVEFYLKRGWSYAMASKMAGISIQCGQKMARNFQDWSDLRARYSKNPNCTSSLYDTDQDKIEKLIRAQRF